MINKYTNLSKKYLDLDYLKNDFKDNSNYNYILNRWQIKNNNNLISLLKNIFGPIYKILFMIKKNIKNIKNKYF